MPESQTNHSPAPTLTDVLRAEQAHRGGGGLFGTRIANGRPNQNMRELWRRRDGAYRPVARRDSAAAASLHPLRGNAQGLLGQDADGPAALQSNTNAPHMDNEHDCSCGRVIHHFPPVSTGLQTRGRSGSAMADTRSAIHAGRVRDRQATSKGNLGAGRLLVGGGWGVGVHRAPMQDASCPEFSFASDEAKAETGTSPVARSGPIRGITGHQGARPNHRQHNPPARMSGPTTSGRLTPRGGLSYAGHAGGLLPLPGTLPSYRSPVRHDRARGLCSTPSLTD